MNRWITFNANGIYELIWILALIEKQFYILQVNIPDDHFRNVPVGALSPSIEMQQKQQQNLLQRTTSISNNSTPQSDSTNKQQKSSSFWNHFGIGGSKQEDTFWVSYETK